MTDLRKAVEELLYAYDKDWLPVGLPNHMKALRQALAHTSALAQPKQRMNERIQELAMELAEQLDWNPPHEPTYYTFAAEDLEKFAELIVQECAEVSKKYAGGSMPVSIALAIKEHFGVKE